MARVIVYHCQPGPQDPIYGICRSTIRERITKRNWRTRAVIREESESSYLYLWIEWNEWDDKEAGITRQAYFVHAVDLVTEMPRNDHGGEFQDLNAALAHINGEDDSLLARSTRLVPRSEIGIASGPSAVVEISRSRPPKSRLAEGGR